MLQLKAPAKLNLFLHVTGQRSDGYHLLQSLFVPINWCDTIQIRPTQNSSIQRLSSHPWLAENDICIKAAQRLKALGISKGQMDSSQGCEINIQKDIPHSAGLGGGSSDAATCLKGLVQLWGLHLSNQELLELGLGLGADVPFFLQPEPALVTGIGETLRAFRPLARQFVVAVPNIEIPTARIFQSEQLIRNKSALSEDAIQKAVKAPVWTAGRNDLLNVALNLYPLLSEDLNLLVDAAQTQGLPAQAVRMSGSGSALFCSCQSAAQARQLADWLISQPASPTRFRGIRAVETYL
jgi:4-diphosphocytidyl-2-C-methyl-D-erythritol kinase